MRELSLSFARPWSIQLPVVSRYLEEEYVDSFFREGKLRLSSFRAFREHTDEQRGDQFEGRVSAEIHGPNVRHSVIAVNGEAAFILCASLVENRRMEASFSTAACIRILDVVAFADMVSRRVPGFVGGFQGNCVYRDDTTLRKQNSQQFVPPSAGEDPGKWATEQDRFVAKQTSEGFFYKRLRYAHQNEYRFIWFAEGNEAKELFVTCPEAVRFCERV
jgi:hypothetical protein